MHTHECDFLEIITLTDDTDHLAFIISNGKCSNVIACHAFHSVVDRRRCRYLEVDIQITALNERVRNVWRVGEEFTFWTAEDAVSLRGSTLFEENPRTRRAATEPALKPIDLEDCRRSMGSLDGAGQRRDRVKWGAVEVPYCATILCSCYWNTGTTARRTPVLLWVLLLCYYSSRSNMSNSIY